tara:strand:+ start:328 stop:660 length:333 start_codon:yes stop_codon:yes gene_type:complete
MPKIKAALGKHGFRGTVRVDAHTTLVLTITSGPYAEINGKYHSVNPYWFEKDDYPEHVKEFLRDVIAAMNDGNWNDSDPMTDYVSVGWFVNVRFGRPGKPFVSTQQEAAA